MSNIGRYLVRYSDKGAAVGLAHYIESEVQDRAISSCGKQLHRRRESGSLRVAALTDPHCSVCPPRQRVEDELGYGQVAPV